MHEFEHLNIWSATIQGVTKGHTHKWFVSSKPVPIISEEKLYTYVHQQTSKEPHGRTIKVLEKANSQKEKKELFFYSTNIFNTCLLTDIFLSPLFIITHAIY